MATPLHPRVRETSTTTGTGSYALAGVPGPSWQTFDDALGGSASDVFYIAAEEGVGWEHGRGTFTAPATLARTEILGSSNSGAAVDWSAGTREVFMTAPPAEVMLKRDGLDGVDPADGRTALGLGDASLRDVGVGASDDVPDRAAADSRYAQIGTLNAPVNTELLFLSAIPAGWTRQDDPSDFVYMGAKSGQSAGDTGGDWNPAATFTVAGTQLTLAQVAQHAHLFFYSQSFVTALSGGTPVVKAISPTFFSGATSTETSSEGNGPPGDSHTHGISCTQNWRPRHKRAVRAKKD